jgi:hypothetical protein
MADCVWQEREGIGWLFLFVQLFWFIWCDSFLEPNKADRPDELDPRHAPRNGCWHLDLFSGTETMLTQL